LPGRKLVWTGGTPVVEPAAHGRSLVILPGRDNDTEMRLASEQASWLTGLIREATPVRGARYPAVQEMRASHPAGARGFEAMLRSAAWKQARAAGLLFV
jgi:hypothetical protein